MKNKQRHQEKVLAHGNSKLVCYYQLRIENYLSTKQIVIYLVDCRTRIAIFQSNSKLPQALTTSLFSLAKRTIFLANVNNTFFTPPEITSSRLKLYKQYQNKSTIDGVGIEAYFQQQMITKHQTLQQILYKLALNLENNAKFEHLLRCAPPYIYFP